ncbi:MAG: hypothetical protein A3G33_08745 [Omnitrophica bacterium RIFCSPLOWO2_12_FULL_44_17]|uniref:Uncharacterized protein n=1 Tax=Candidatus Danuiimicrobium aquiferis TaxID=1801832 RepID=A0A1G1L0T7_9BACT|nr:MAG: hypothetical protein A3G33_08745 [Omnitrophica bacterium RIFCSPLOWO2_12_FULL_44_17]
MKRPLILIILLSLMFYSFAAIGSAEEAMAPSTVPDSAATTPAKTTLDNLMAAFNGESNANTRYLGFTEKSF